MSVSTLKVGDYKIVGDLFDGSEEILTSDAMNFVISIQNKFGDKLRTWHGSTHYSGKSDYEAIGYHRWKNICSLNK